MIIFLKAQFSSLVATAVDFAFTVCLIEFLQFTYLTSTSIGALAGAITNFSINKFWSFNKAEKSLKKQTLRYAIVWSGSITLNVIGSTLFLSIFQTSYAVSKIIVAFFVGVAFNYTMQKHYVFTNAKN